MKVKFSFIAAIAAPLFLLAGPAVRAQAASPQPKAHIRFTFEDPQLHPVRYSLQIEEDGEGSYESTAGGPLAADRNNADAGSAPIFAPDQSRTVHVSEALSARLFLLARRNKLFAVPCQGRSKVAFDGTKTLEYQGPEGQGSCTFTWTQTKDIDELRRSFEGIALTLDVGARLALERAHTPLALDVELNSFSAMADQGQALEMENIAPVLTAIASDDAVLKRDQRWAQALLSGGKSKKSK